MSGRRRSGNIIAVDDGHRLGTKDDLRRRFGVAVGASASICGVSALTVNLVFGPATGAPAVETA